MSPADLVSKAFNAVARNEKPDLSHPASHGSSNNHEHEHPTGIIDLLTSDETTKQIKSQGNNGTGMEDGLHKKAINQQERVAERSRLSEAGMFEPHLKHEELTNLTAEHQAVADGKNVFPVEDASSERQV